MNNNSKKTNIKKKNIFQKLYSRYRNINNKKDEGFSFFEIIVALIIISILASLVGITVFSNISKAQRISAKSQIQTFALALNSYFTDCGKFPTEDQGLEALWLQPPDAPKGWDGPYLDSQIPDDPWDNEYIYKTPGPHGLPFEIICLGTDGSEGGEDNDKDITSWEALN